MSMNPDRDNTTREQTCQETCARSSSQPRVGTQTEAQAEMLNIQHYRSSLWIFLQSPEIPPCCEALTISLRIANSFSLVAVSRGETIVAYLAQNNH